MLTSTTTNMASSHPGWLFQSNFARAIDPLTGAFKFNITDVPSGSEAIGPAGEWLRYVIRNAGDTIISKLAFDSMEFI